VARSAQSPLDLSAGADVRHGASFGAILSLAEDAFEEARVVKIARTFAPKR
jgi:hypothetical protein